MPRMYHRSSRAGGVFIATPTRSPSPGYSFALFQSQQALAQAGISSELALYAGDCHVDDARNRLVRDFLETNCTDLVFIDDDVRWEPEDLVRLCQYDRDVVGASYPFKQDEEGFPVAFLGGDIRADADGLIEVLGVPTGFLRIRRHVLQKLADRAQQFRPKNDSRSFLPLIFEREIQDGLRRGGDYAFCRKWRELGGKIFIAPEISLEHAGENQWHGSLGHFKRVELYGPVAAGIMEIRAGLETPKTFMDMVTGWDNVTWACDSAMLYTLALLARKVTGPILECGSGLSTLVMAAANPKVEIHSLEHDAKWVDRMQSELSEHGIETSLHHAPLKRYGDYCWYGRIPEDQFSLAICDGPPRKLGDRRGFFELCADRIRNAVVVMDDADDPNCISHITRWARSAGRRFQVVGRARQFAVSPVGV